MMAAGGARTPDSSLLSIVTPALNEADNLPLLHQRIVAALAPLQLSWEWVIVDDHSSDETWERLAALNQSDPRVRAIRLSRNSGSHISLLCGLEAARGDAAAVLAADLQDPPEVLAALLEKWRAGAQVVWAVRRAREGESGTTVASSRLFYAIMRHVAGLRSFPPSGSDFFLLDRQVTGALTQFGEHNVSAMSLLSWMGFRQDFVYYDKAARLHGRSGWTLEKKIKLAIDSITSFTYLPIRVMSYFGFVVAVLGFLYAAWIVVNAFRGYPVPGWSSLAVIVLLLGGLQMMMLGVLGEYLWRALDEARRRPRWIAEAVIPAAPLGAPAGAVAAAGAGTPSNL